MTKKIARFDYDKPEQPLAKMRRELERIAAAKTKADSTDHAINFCLTAWHMNEWAWSVLCRDVAFRGMLSSATGVTYQAVDRSTFTSWVEQKIGRNIYHVCQIISNQAKHTKSSRFDLDSLDVHSSAQSAPVISLTMISDSDAFQVPSYYQEYFPGVKPSAPALDAALNRDALPPFPEAQSMLHLRVAPPLRLKIIVDGTKYAALEVFGDVMRFWDSFAEKYFVVEAEGEA